MTYYALSQTVFEALQRGESSPSAPSAQQRLEFIQARAGKRTAQVGAGLMTIPVKGVLTKEPDLLAMLFGGGNSTYSSIIDALSEADRDPSVQSVQLDVDSPGGEVAGLFELLDAIEAFSKPIGARASRALSAAYAIAAATGEIEAVNAASEFGSVGVVASMWVSDSIVTVTSTEAPDKRPDPKSDAGRATIRKHLDDFHSLFVGAIAKGRSTTADRVNSDFGRGGIVLARDAVQRGMIDRVSKPAWTKSPMALTQKMCEHIDAGPLPGESTEAFVQRGLRMLRAEEELHAAAERDLGDQVAALMLERRGKMPAERAEQATPAPQSPPTPEGDLGDQVVALMREKRGSK